MKWFVPVAVVTVAALLIGVIIFVFLQPVESRIIYIRANGVVEGTGKINRMGSLYTFTGNIHGSVIVQRDDIVIDGADHMLQGRGNGTGIDLTERTT
jgi:hypothetical protein